MTHLEQLEAEAIYIMREVAATCEKPVMLYSIGKDSSVMLHLAMKAFYPELPPFPFLHVDTTWKFHELIEFRDRIAAEKGIEMLVHINEDGVQQGINPFDHGSAYTDIMKTQALKQALNKYGFTAAFGGGRRDEEKSRAKERIENCIALLGCEPDDTFKYLGRLLRRMLLLGYNPTMEHAVIKLVLVKIVQCRSLLVYANDELNVL